MSRHPFSWPIGLALLLPLLLQGCGSGYSTDFPPPSGNETYAEVMPASIGDQAAVILPLPLDKNRYNGARARYGSLASVEIIKVRSAEDMDAYVKEHIKPRLDGYTHRVSGKFNGVWSLRGNDKFGRLQSWQNHNWLFLIEATSDESFEEVVENFAYIQRG